MDDQQITQITAILSERSLGRSSSIPLRVVLDALMPAGIKQYMLMELVSRLDKELIHSPHLSKIDLQDPSIGRLRETLLKGLAAGYLLSRDEFSSLLHNAVRFTGHYLTRPQWTIENLLFEEHQDITLPFLRARLEYCADYRYFGRFLQEVLVRRHADRISRDECRTLLARIDEQIVRQHTPAELAFLTKPIFDFILLKDTSFEDSIPLEPVLTFFEDKKMNLLKDHIASICRLRESATITISALADLIRGLNEGRDREGTVPSVQPEPNTPEVAEERAAAPKERAGTLADSAQEEVMPPADEESPLPDIRTLMDEKQRQRFVRHVFNKDQAYFYGVIATLNTMLSWKDAAVYLGKVYDINKLDPFADVVVEFTDLIQKRFNTPAEASR